MHLLARCRSSAPRLFRAAPGACLALLLPGCTSLPPATDVSAAPRVPSPERVSLGFRWPQGFAVRVTGVESNRIVTDLVEDESRTEMSYRVSVEPDPGGARIRYDDFSLEDPQTDALVRLRSVPGLEALCAALHLSFVVSPDGRFGGTPGLDDAVGDINRVLDTLHARPEGLPPGAPLLPTRFSAELFRRHAPLEWWPLVELWAGREIELGARYEVDLVTRMPLLEGTPIKMDGELQVSGRVPCDPGREPADPTPRCVELVLISRPDPLDLLPLLGGEGERHRADGGSAPITVTKLELDETVRLVTEPETLVPHRVETSRRARVSLRLSDGSLHTDALDQATDLVFHPES